MKKIRFFFAFPIEILPNLIDFAYYDDCITSNEIIWTPDFIQKKIWS